MEILSLVLHFCVVLAALIAYLNRPRIGGQLVKGVQRIVAGVLMLGFAHLMEVLLPFLFNLSPILNENIHELLEAGSIILTIMGLARMRMAFDARS